MNSSRSAQPAEVNLDLAAVAPNLDLPRGATLVTALYLDRPAATHDWTATRFALSAWGPLTCSSESPPTASAMPTLPAPRATTIAPVMISFRLRFISRSPPSFAWRVYRGGHD
jgi:hypothetical protein